MPEVRFLFFAFFFALSTWVQPAFGQASDSVGEFDTTTFLQEESSGSQVRPADAEEEGEGETDMEVAEENRVSVYQELMRNATDTLYDTLPFRQGNLFSAPLDWKSQTKGLDYRDKTIKSEPEKPEKSKWKWNWDLPNWDWAMIGQLLGRIGLFLLLLLLAFLVFRLIQSTWKETELKREEIFSWETNPDKLSLSFLEESLQKALREGNKPAALRIMFLMVLKDLNSLGIIRWRRNKTNLHYLREIENPAILKPFRLLSYAFDAAQYGGYSISDAAFSRLDGEFRALSTFLEPFRQAGAAS